MVEGIGSSALLSSGLALFASAGGRMSAAAESLSGGSLERLAEAALALRMARQEAKLGAVVMKTAMEMDEARLDILA